MVKSVAHVPEFVNVIGFGITDENRYMVAFQVGEEEPEVAYLDEFYDALVKTDKKARQIQEIIDVIREVFGDDEDEKD